MATSRRKGTNENINTYGGAGQGRDYTVLGTWEAATDIDLVAATQSEILECYDDAAEFDDNTGVNGATTNASYFRIVRPAGTIGTGSWEGHDGTPNNGFKFHNTAAAIQCLDFTEAYSGAQDLIIQQTNPSSTSTPALNGNGGNNLFVGCILVDITSANNDARGINMADDCFAVNCLAIRVDQPAFLSNSGGSGASYCLNCTAIDNGQGFNEFTADPTWINCLADGNTGFDFDSGELLGLNNASSDGTAPGTGSRINQTFTFVNTGNDDYHLTGSDAGARTYGQDLSAYGVFAFDDDIDGQTRS